MTKIHVKIYPDDTGDLGVRIPIRVIRNDSDRKRELFLQRYALRNYWKKFVMGFGIMAIAFVFTPYALAGTGPSSNATWESNFFWEVIFRDTTSTLIDVHYPSDFDMYSTPVNAYLGTIDPNTVSSQPPVVQISSYSYNNLEDIATYRLHATSGTISLTIYNENNPVDPNLPLHTTSSPPSFIANNYFSDTNWDSAYWDIDTLDIGNSSSSYTTSSASCYMVVPSNGSVSPVTSFYKAYFAYNTAGVEWHPGIDYKTYPNDPTYRSSTEPWNSIENISSFQSTNEALRSNGYYSFNTNEQDVFDFWYANFGGDIINEVRPYIRLNDGTKYYCEDEGSISVESMSYNSSTWTTTTVPDGFSFKQITKDTLRSDCEAPGDWTDIGGGLYYASCSFWNFLFKVDDVAFDPFRTASETFKSLRPFSYFFDIKDKLSESVESAGASSTPTLTLSLPIANDTFVYNVLSSSTLSNVVGNEQKGNIFTVQAYMMYLVTLFVAWRIFRLIA